VSGVGHVRLEAVSKTFGTVRAVRDVDLDIQPGEFFSLLGPSGCGKTTTLRLIAGLESPTSGRIVIDGETVNRQSPGQRDVAMVFQNYALYGHMRIFDNIAFPLRMRKMPNDEIRTRVDAVARRLRLEALLGRKPGELSGGQQQRVALGRAIVREPRAFLMDEPLSNLDARLRLELRVELKNLHRTLGTTTIYVTHDQEEAMAMSGRIAVFSAGRVLQVGSPAEIYARPSSVPVARFVGTLPMNFFPVELRGEDGALGLEGPHFRLPLPDRLRPAVERHRAPAGYLLGVRPKDFEILPDRPEGSIPAEVFLVEPTGDYTVVDVRVGDAVYKVRSAHELPLQPGEVVGLRPSAAALHLFDAETEARVGDGGEI
jgi:multiple sugar transport system ATP-binding protein